MIVIMTAKKLEKICQDFYDRGVAKGYELGYKMGKSDRTNLGFIIGSRVDKQMKEYEKERPP